MSLLLWNRGQRPLGDKQKTRIIDTGKDECKRFVRAKKDERRGGRAGHPYPRAHLPWGGAEVPQVLERAMVARAGELRNVEVVHVLTFAGGEYLNPEYTESFHHRALFIGGTRARR
ncbi:MAG: hypothetical protein ACRDFQ_00105 [Anaerolineales bacterium]